VRQLRNLLAVVLALGAGLSIAYTYHLVTDRGPEASAALPRRGSLSRALATIGPATDGSPSTTPPSIAVATTDPPQPPASTARDAVARFLELESRQDFASSYGVLSAPDRAAAGSRAQWAANHDELPAITAFHIDRVADHGDRADVVTRVDLHAGLSEVTGLVPAHASANYVAVMEDGGWRVSFADSALTPDYPPDSLAVDAVRAWASRRQRCKHAIEYDGGLLGLPTRASALCHARGPVRVAGPRALPDTRADEPFLAAFGPSVHDWARVVPLTAPVRMDVVVAPVGEHWLVIGVQKASSGR
jgi:hypothetical protein